MGELKEMLVLKVGTSTLVEGGQLDKASFGRIGRQIGELQMRGCGTLLVTSGVRNRLPYLGWRHVVETWRDAIGGIGGVGEVGGEVKDFLLTEEQLDAAGGCDFVVAAVQAGHVAITNAHDEVLPAGSQYASNDLVGARLAMHASGLGLAARYVMLSDVHGVYDDMRRRTVISTIHDVDEYRHLAGGTSTFGATGGMATKFTAAAITTAAGIETHIAHGRTENAALLAVAGEIGTRFTIKQQATQEAL